MIDKIELRIGNKVSSPHHNLAVATIQGMLTSDLVLLEEVTTYDFFSSIEPIAITEEWLAKFGFVKDEQHECFVLWRAECEVEVSYFDDAVNIVGYSAADTLEHIKFVHQLQNLYFALTGEELTIKETA